jgi:hypothetical protein
MQIQQEGRIDVNLESRQETNSARDSLQSDSMSATRQGSLDPTRTPCQLLICVPSACLIEIKKQDTMLDVNASEGAEGFCACQSSKSVRFSLAVYKVPSWQ